MYNFEVLALYNNHWGDFDFNATLGGNVYKVNNQTTVTTAQDMKIRDVPSLTSFNEISVVPGSYRKQINSVYGAVNVGWKHMLYLDAVETDKSDNLVTRNYVGEHVEIGIASLRMIIDEKKTVKHLKFDW